MINSKNDTFLYHIILTPTSSSCDMTIRSQSNQICEYIKNSTIIIYYEHFRIFTETVKYKARFNFLFHLFFCRTEIVIAHYFE